MSRRKSLSLAILGLLSAPLYAQDQADAAADASKPRATASNTSNNTAVYETRRVQEMSGLQVTAKSLDLGGGNMTIQTAPKAISTVSRAAIEQSAGGNNFTQLISAIPGVDTATDDSTGLSNGNYSLRGFDSSSIGITVNGAPITDTGSYSVYATEYGDGENFNDITVTQGTPNVDSPQLGASGGEISWSTIDPTHKPGLDFNQSLGNNDYRRTFLRLNTGDTGPLRSWISYSKNSTDKWKGKGDIDVTKVDGKTLWQIDKDNSISGSFQYSRQVSYAYGAQTKAAIRQDYDADYNEDWLSNGANTGNANYWKLRTNPFSSVMASLDGEFTLNDNLRLSVVPYFWYGTGGGGSGSPYFYETTNTSRDQYDYSHQDLNGDGVIGGGSRYTAYGFSYSRTSRPGIVTKFIQDLGMDHNLVYGFWYERSRKTQNQNFSTVDQASGTADDFWADSNYIYYPDGKRQEAYRSYTVTPIQKYFVQDNWTPNDHWQLTAGVSYLKAKREGTNYQVPSANYSTYAIDPATGNRRYTEGGGPFSSSYNKWLPAFGAKFSPDDKNQIFYSIAKTLRVPPTNAITLNAYTGNATSKAETALTHDLGWRYYGDRFGVSAMLYQSNYNHKQISSYDNALATTTYVEVPKVRMRGANAEASYALTDSLKLYGSYTYTQATMRKSLEAGDNGIYPTSGKQLVNTPRNQGNLIVSYSSGAFWGSLKLRYSGARYGDFMNTEKVGGYTTLNLNSGYNFRDFAWLEKPYIKLNAYNLLNRKAYTWANSVQLLASSGAAQYAGQGLYSTNPQYGVLQDRSFSVTFGASFF